MAVQTWLLATIFLILTKLLASTMAQTWCFNNGNYTNNGTYRNNLYTLLSSLATNVDDYGFYSASMGQNPDTVYGSVICREDVQLQIYRTCIQDAAVDIERSCPNYKQVVNFNEFCTVRYSDESMLGILAGMTLFALSNAQNASSPDQFMLDLRVLQDNLREQAANGGSLRKVAAGNRSTTVAFQIVFSLNQCSPYLSVEECRTCLIGAATDIPRYCNSKRGCPLQNAEA